MNTLWIFFLLVLFCVYILLGLHLTENLDSLPELVLNWVIYTILWLTLVNVFVLGYFWSVVKNKKGPAGIKGPAGDRGIEGDKGQCSIDAEQAFTVKTLNEYIDGLYNGKTNQNILDTDTQSFNNKYLNNKIRVMVGSKQFTNLKLNLAKDNQNLDSLINYMKSIWMKWFELLYNATETPGVWFTDEYADEEYNWSDDNPFVEIRKYDIYYWGITPNFRPLKAEICRNTPFNVSAKLPIPNKGLVPRLKIIESNDYKWLGTDNDTRGSPDASFWRPKKVVIGTDEYFPVGDIITAGHRGVVWKNNYGKKKTVINKLEYDSGTVKPDGPKMKSILIAGDLKDPIKSEQKGGRAGLDKITNQTLVCPTGYTSMGDAFGTKFSNGVVDLKCVPTDCLEKIQNRKPINVWDGKKVGYLHYLLNDYRGIEDAKGENAYNLYRLDKNGPFYKIKDSCLAVKDRNMTKESEPQNDDLGIGWYGHPYNLDPKYSIFTFLNLVPEGLIVHQGTGRRFYIVHYGGEDVNAFNVLDYDDDTSNYTMALQVASNKNDSKVDSRKLSRKDARQKFIVELQRDAQGNKKKLRLKNVMNNKYLYLGLDPTLGDSQFSTVDVKKYKDNEAFKKLTEAQLLDGITFYFLPAFGANMDIVEKAAK